MSDMDREDRTSIDQLRHAIRSGRIDRAEIQELLDGQESTSFAEPAPITDKFNVADIRRGHARIRASRRKPKQYLLVTTALLMVAVAFAWRALWLREEEHAGSEVVVGGAERGTAASPIVQPSPSEPVNSLAAHSSRRQPPREEEPEVEITPTARPNFTRTDGNEGARAPRPEVPIRVARTTSGVASAKTAVVTGNKPAPKSFTKTTLGRESVASVIPDEEFNSPVRPRPVPETASFTPMAKEQVVVDAREGRRSREPERRDDPMAKRGSDDDTVGYGARQDMQRNESKTRGRPSGPLVERRICLESRMLAGDRCPHTAIVALPESEIPTRQCRVH